MSAKDEYELVFPNTPLQDNGQSSNRTAGGAYPVLTAMPEGGTDISMDKAYYTVDEDGQAYYVIGRTRIRITEHFPETGKSMGERIEDLLLTVARHEVKLNDRHP